MAKPQKKLAKLESTTIGVIVHGIVLTTVFDTVFTVSNNLAPTTTIFLLSRQIVDVKIMDSLRRPTEDVELSSNVITYRGLC